MGGHIMLAVVIGFTGIFTMDNLFMGGAIAGIAAGGAIFLYFLELLVAFIQAFIFTMLSALFIGMAVQDHHADEHGAHESAH
jgi:F-type H+-transporting ATPase subunit a